MLTEFVELFHIHNLYKDYDYSQRLDMSSDRLRRLLKKKQGLKINIESYSSMLILCIFGGIVPKIIGVTVVYTENTCFKHFLIKIWRHKMCMKSYGIRDSELTH
jgi:hypothetical protein